MTNPNDVLPTDIALNFGRQIVEIVGEDPYAGYPDVVLESIASRVFKRSLEIAEQIDFGSEDVR